MHVHFGLKSKQGRKTRQQGQLVKEANNIHVSLNVCRARAVSSLVPRHLILSLARGKLNLVILVLCVKIMAQPIRIQNSVTVSMSWSDFIKLEGLIASHSASNQCHYPSFEFG